MRALDSLALITLQTKFDEVQYMLCLSVRTQKAPSRVPVVIKPRQTTPRCECGSELWLMNNRFDM